MEDYEGIACGQLFDASLFEGVLLNACRARMRGTRPGCLFEEANSAMAW